MPTRLPAADAIGDSFFVHSRPPIDHSTDAERPPLQRMETTSGTSSDHVRAVDRPHSRLFGCIRHCITSRDAEGFGDVWNCLRSGI